MLFSEPKIPQTSRQLPPGRTLQVSVLFSEPKIPQTPTARMSGSAPHAVSVLFSEPKIPQIFPRPDAPAIVRVSVLFSEPKIPQTSRTSHPPGFSSDVSVLFSEPKIPQSNVCVEEPQERLEFQCSSASRKFLKQDIDDDSEVIIFGFSALQRAENSSKL